MIKMSLFGRQWDGWDQGVGPQRAFDPLDVGGRMRSRRGRRSKGEIYGCSGGGQEVGRCEGSGGRGEG